jgi:hypothetical protein
MGFLSKRLMKWREPKIKGMLTPKNVLAVFVLILIVSIPFGFLAGNGKFHISTCFLGFGFMSLASIGFLIQPFLPGILVQLKEDMIVRGARGTNSQRSAYQDIDCINFYRDCSYSWNGSRLVINIHQRSVEGPNFTSFVVVMKNESFRSVQTFAVPDNVNLNQVLQILRDKGVNVFEGQLPS